MRNPFKRAEPEGKALSASPGALDLLSSMGGSYFQYPRSAYVDGAFYQAQAASYAAIYASHPNVRTVVDWIATNVVEPGMKLYERKPNNDRSEDGDHPAAESIRSSRPRTGQRELLEWFLKDFLVYDNAYLLKFRGSGGLTTLVPVPPHAMGVTGRLLATGYRLMHQDGTWTDLNLEDVIHFCGYSALDRKLGVSKLETLRQELIAESTRQAADIEFNRGGRVKGGIIERPADVPDWSEQARGRFEEDWANRMKGANAGKSPVLEEGMKFIDAGVTPKDSEALQSKELALASVARLYGLHPSLFLIEGGGALEEVRAAAEEDVLKPLSGRVAEVFNEMLVGEEYDDKDTHYFEFNARPPSDYAKAVAADVSAAGGPFTTRNEVRRRRNLPPVEGGDELITPLNVVVGDNPKPSPAVMPAQDPNGPAQDGSHREEPKASRTKALRIETQLRRRDEYAAEHAELLRKFFRRQHRTLKSKANGFKALDTARWDKELASDLNKLAKKTVDVEGEIAATRMMGEFDPGKVVNYLAAGSAATASAINVTTQSALDEGADPEDVFADATNDRADEIATHRATALVSFAHMEAGKQNVGPGELRLKQWVWSGKSNSRHRHLSGESVPLFGQFSNGAQYPGDPSLPVGQTARCHCSLTIL